MNTESQEPIVSQELPPSVKNATSIRELLLVAADMEQRYGRPFLPNYPLGEESGKMYGAEGLQTILEKVHRGEENVWAIPEEYGIREKAVEIFEFERMINVGIAKSIEEIHKNFEVHKKEAENLPYHDTLHTTGVMKRVERILLEIQKAAPDLVSDRDIQLARFIASHHDIVQGWRRKIVDDGEFKKEIRERFRVTNEKESALKAIEYMERVNEEAGREIFSDEDKKIAAESIGVTIPDFDIEAKTVVQRGLKNDSSLVARAIALADLGDAGMGGHEEFVRGGDNLFREENLDILRDRKRMEKISLKKKEYYRSRMLSWRRSQADFARGREALLPQEIERVPEAARGRVRLLFSKFGDSIIGAEQTAVRREKMTCEEIMRDMGYFDMSIRD